MESDDNDVPSDFLFLLFSIVAGILFFSASFPPWLRWISRRKLEQWQIYQRDGKIAHGTLTYSGTSHEIERNIIGYEGIYKYRVQLVDQDDKLIEIAKTRCILGTCKPENVETVELLVLPGYPKSGMSTEHIQNEIDKIEEELLPPWLPVALLVASLPFWIFVLIQGDPYAIGSLFSGMLLLLSFLFLWAAVQEKEQLKREWNQQIDPTKNVTVTELNPDDHDPRLPPLCIFYVSTQNGQNPEILPFLSSLELE